MSDQLELLLRENRPTPPPPSAEAVRRAREAASEAVERLRVRRRARVALVAAAAALGALFVSPVGIGGELAKLVTGTPAPPAIRKSFAYDNEMRAAMYAHAAAAGHVLKGRYSQVIADQAVGVMSIDSIDGPIDLWAAPTEDGRQCWLIQVGADRQTGRPYGYGSCDDADDTTALHLETYWDVARPNVNIVHARVYDESVTTVSVQVENGTDLSLPVKEGHALGWIAKPARVTRATALDENGDVVASWDASA